MFNSALEQFEIVPFLSFALPKVRNVSFFTQSFDLPNSLLSFIFAIFFLIPINKLLNSDKSWKPNPVPSHIKRKFKMLYQEYKNIFDGIKRTGKLSKSDLIRLKQLLVEILQLQDKYKCIHPVRKGRYVLF